MYERKNEALLSRKKFASRLVNHTIVAAVLIAVSLGIGIIGYHYICGFIWIDSLLNASMILTGMGPVGEMKSDGAKLFASGYALFSGVAFLSVVGVLFAPFVHRILHRFHLDPDEEN